MRLDESNTRNLRVCVCVVTKGRPVMLRRLLQSLTDQRFDSVRAPVLSTVVVDNDPSESARVVVTEFINANPNSIVYDIEDTPGIAAARNRAIALAGDVDLIAFIDDDEEASPHWLQYLLTAHRAYQADIVIGPVIPRFESEVPAWIEREGLFDRERYPTGASPRWGRTGNALIMLALLRQVEGPFNERLGLTGGEDTHLFERLRPLCKRMVWSDEAIVTEHLPSSRARATGWLRRQFQLGNSAVCIDLQLASASRRLFKRAVEGGIFTFVGAIMIAPAFVLGRGKSLRACGALMRGIGIFTGLIGYRHRAYRKVHGH